MSPSERSDEAALPGAPPWEAPVDPPARLAGPRLLAIDAGVRAGIAIYGPGGQLERYRSTNFGSTRTLRTAVYRVMSEIADLEQVVIEGAGGGIALPWIKESERRGLRLRQVNAGIWREQLLLPRDRRTGSAAKEQADLLARKVIEWSGAKRPTSLRHDAAEAILIGLWGVVTAGWLTELPAELRPR